MQSIVLISYVLVVLALLTFAIAIWSLRWPRTKGTIDVSIFDREWTAESSGSETNFEKMGKFYLAYTYSVAGVMFQKSRIAPLVDVDWQISGSPNLSGARDRASWYREGP